MATAKPTFEDDFRFVLAKTGRPKPGRSDSGPSEKGMRRALIAATQRKPQVMIKITRFSKSMQQLRAHLDYISRNGQNEVFDHTGNSFDEIGKRLGMSGRDALYSYGHELADGGITAETGRKKGRPRSRTAMHLMLSMPPGTDTGAFELSVRDFLADTFGDHDHVFTFHDDTAHYHAHVVVGLQGRDGKWLNPRREHLRAWRQGFAESLERHGIEAQATPSYSRGKGKGGYRRDLHELGKRGKRQRPDPSPTYDHEIEQSAIEKRADAWTRIADHYAAAGDNAAADTVRDYLAEHYSRHPVPSAPTPTRSGDRER